MLRMSERAVVRYGLAFATATVATALGLAVEPLVHSPPSPPFVVPHVFEPYRQDAPGAGLGLGLAIVRELVELHGGRVEAHSPGIGYGAQFTVMLPTRDHEHGSA